MAEEVKVTRIWGVGGTQQSQGRERIRRALQKLLPAYDFTAFPVQSLRPYQRDGELPAWSIGAKRKTDNKYFDVYCHDTMSDCFLFGLQVATEAWDSIQITAAWPERTAIAIREDHNPNDERQGNSKSSALAPIKVSAEEWYGGAPNQHCDECRRLGICAYHRDYPHNMGSRKD